MATWAIESGTWWTGYSSSWNRHVAPPLAAADILAGLATCLRQNENMFYLPPVEFNLADLFEHAVDVFGEREYLVANGVHRTYAEMEARANQLAHHLAAEG